MTHEEITSKFSIILGLLENIKNKKSPLGKDKNSLEELISRLQTARDSFEDLMILNKQYLEIDPYKIEISLDSETGILTSKFGGKIQAIKINRADPNVPVQIVSTSSVSSFGPDEGGQDLSDDIKQLRKNISYKLESFYFNANKAWDLLEESLCKRKKAKFIGIAMVRHKLVEHTEEGDIFSFGVSKEWGPRVKPMQISNRKEKYHDLGLIKNTGEFLLEIEKDLQ